MHRSKKYINRTSTICVVFSLFRPILAAGCDAAAPDVTEALIIAEVCDQTSVIGYSTCAKQMTDYMQQSATNTCDRYSALSTDCLIANDNDHTVCADSLFGYNDCHNYTMQAYAYCGCYYSLPESLAACANEQLQPQAQDILPQTSTLVTAVPLSSDMPASAASTDKEPTPGVPTVSGGATSSSSSQNAVTFSDPRAPNTARLRIASIQEVIPSSDPKTAWTPDATPSTTSEPIITIVVTHTANSTSAWYTTNATLTSTPIIISTVYTCTNDGGGGHDAAVPSTPVSAASASATTILPPIAPAPVVGPEPFAPNPAAVVPAPGTEAEKKTEATIITTERTSGSPEPSPPSTSVPAQAQIPAASTLEGTTEMTGGSPETSPPSTSVPAQSQSPAASIAEGTTEMTGGSPEPSLPSTSMPAQAQSPAASTAEGTSGILPSKSAIPSALSTGLVAPSEATAGRNASAVCASCRRKRKSKIF